MTQFTQMLTMEDINKRIQPFLTNKDKTQPPDSFAGRAELYYNERPQLLSLLHDLYTTYLSLSDRYPRSHNQQLRSHSTRNNIDVMVAEMVIQNVEFEFMVHELGVREIHANESYRKLDLQRSLVEVLESERLILLNENAGLRFQVSSLIKENQGLVSECLYMRRRAGELAQCVMSIRDEHRVFMMRKKIEDLEGKVYSLKKCEDFEGGISSRRVRVKNKEINKLSKWWRKVMSFDLLFVCNKKN